MFLGPRGVSKNKSGLTLVEVLVSVFLLSIISLAVSALYVASQKFYFTANDKVIISYELQYAIDHIYKYVMQGIGDKNSPAIPDPDGGDTLTININTNDPLNSANYSATTPCRYYKSDNELMFDNGSTTESLVPKVSVTAVSFSLNGNLLTIYLTGSYKDQTLTFYSACYPRLASFQ
jgi:prepilin-type N-terminal cleavage/methylation domain-containing protein